MRWLRAKFIYHISLEQKETFQLTQPTKRERERPAQHTHTRESLRQKPQRARVCSKNGHEKGEMGGGGLGSSLSLPQITSGFCTNFDSLSLSGFIFLTPSRTLARVLYTSGPSSPNNQQPFLLRFYFFYFSYFLTPRQYNPQERQPTTYYYPIIYVI